MKSPHLDQHIMNIVQNHQIHEQSDLKRYLKERGYEVPQATLSRRLKKMNIVKVSGIYKIIDQPQHVPMILNVQVSNSGLIVLHTHPGSASSLAYYFDQHYVKGNCGSILGTIAGDDTILLILKDQGDAQSIVQMIQKDFPYLSVN